MAVFWYAVLAGTFLPLVLDRLKQLVPIHELVKRTAITRCFPSRRWRALVRIGAPLPYWMKTRKMRGLQGD
ncbi:hypothetical protein KCP76_02640 [Salmonella enterica subsp. enterica serovar Weltevreden]|nr:hypothetical protein KCP76_02640 [Salmonella enterica subsp. enterica serovar Weltevreden]